MKTHKLKITRTKSLVKKRYNIEYYLFKKKFIPKHLRLYGQNNLSRFRFKATLTLILIYP